MTRVNFSNSTHLPKMQKAIILSVVTLFALSFIVIAQETTPESSTPAQQTDRLVEERLTIETRDKETPAMKGLKLERTFRRAVPQGYGPVVDATQREQIYKIQEEYFEVIALLELRVELLKKERDAKVEGLLTPDQLQRVRPVRMPLLRR